jgi:hypothetical protein
MTSPLHDVCLASLPRGELAALAPLRGTPGIRVGFEGGRAWVRWHAGDEQVLRCVLPLAGVRLYAPRDGGWIQVGRHLPAFDVPAALDERPLHDVLTPAPVQPVPPPALELRPVALTLVPDNRPRPTTAMTCLLPELAAWADTVPGSRLATIHAARCEERLLLVGERLPLLPSGERFWGRRVLVPLGFRPEPALPESAICAALEVADDDLLLMSAAGAEVIAGPVLQPLTRAGLRLAGREVVR